MDDNKNLEYDLPQNAYSTFDATTLKDFIIQRLDENSTFTDQNYEGSNLASFIDIVAYSYHVLLFYLNQTSSETLFNQSNIYENMNRIVQLIGYKPVGRQTSIIPVTCVASSSLSVDSYFLRKYSYFLVDGIQYTVLDDFTFDKSLAGEEEIDTIKDNLILYQGTVEEYPLYEGQGVDFETFPIVVDNLLELDDDKFISHNTISVYVKESGDDKWHEYVETENLFLNESNSRVYDLRLNENGHYEVKFGNDTFGRRLKKSEEVAVYYILSDSEQGQISKNALNGNKLFTYNKTRFNQIFSDTNTLANIQIDTSNSSFLSFKNTQKSTISRSAETVEQIRENTPAIFTSQYRLVTERDYEIFLSKNFSNILNSVKVVNNSDYLKEYIDYYYRICIDPNKVNRVILNQVNFADSCDFNNVNVFVSPIFGTLKDEEYPNFLPESVKRLIIDSTKDRKMINYEVVPRDPVYVAFDIGYGIRNRGVSTSKVSKIHVVREINNKVSKETLKAKISSEIVKFFHPTNNKLGQYLNLSALTSNILSLNGVRTIRVLNTDENVQLEGLSFISWNPLFPDVDENMINQSTTLPFFKFPYLYRPNSLINKIEVIDE